MNDVANFRDRTLAEDIVLATSSSETGFVVTGFIVTGFVVTGFIVTGFIVIPEGNLRLAFLIVIPEGNLRFAAGRTKLRFRENALSTRARLGTRRQNPQRAHSLQLYLLKQMSKSFNNLQPWGAFLLRLVLGAAMIAHGYGKVVPASLFHGNMLAPLQHSGHFVTAFGLPAWLGYVSALTEFVGGILLLLGLLTRFAAFMVAVNMAFAIVLVTRHHGYAGSEYPLALFSIALMLLFYGAGTLALDRRFGLS